MPSDQVQLLSVDEVLAIHDRLKEAFGGANGIRDPGLLESALFRPQTGYYEDLIEMAAALFWSLILNHQFVDGNKRVAFFATDIFLRLNDSKFSVEGKATHGFMTGLLDSNTCNYRNLLPWIHKSIVTI